MAIRKETYTDFLKEVSLFDGLQDKTLSLIFRLGKVQHFKAGDLIIRENQEGGNLYIIITGRAEVVKAGKDPGSNKHLADLERGSVFGEMSVFDNAPCSASVLAKEECSVHMIEGPDFKKFLKKNPEVAFDVFCTLISQISSRLRRTNLALSLLEFS